MGLAVGDDLDAHDIAGLEEVLPGLDRVGGAGEGPSCRCRVSP